MNGGHGGTIMCLITNIRLKTDVTDAKVVRIKGNPFRMGKEGGKKRKRLHGYHWKCSVEHKLMWHPKWLIKFQIVVGISQINTWTKFKYCEIWCIENKNQESRSYSYEMNKLLVKPLPDG